MSTILTDDDIRALISAHGSNAAPTESNGYTTGDYPLARAVIAAYEAKLARQEPVAHRYRFGDVWMFDTYRWNGQDADEVVPVYEHPAPIKDEHSPCMGTNCGKTRYDQEHSAECIAETAESQGWYTHPTPQQADRQRVPEGYVLVPVEALTRWRDAFAEELAAYDIDPPIHHVLTSHDEIAAMLAAAPEAPAQTDTDAINRGCYYTTDLMKAPAQDDRRPVSEGHVLVPVKTTQEMMDAAMAYVYKHGFTRGAEPGDVYAAMLAAMLAAALEAPAQAEHRVPDGVWEALQRMIEDGMARGQASREDAKTVSLWRARFVPARDGKMSPQVAPEAPAQASAGDEREAFEAWAKAYGRVFLEVEPKLGRNGVTYKNQFTQEAWVGWQARAAMTQKGGAA